MARMMPQIEDARRAPNGDLITLGGRRRAIPSSVREHLVMSNLSEEQRLMRQSCRDFVDDAVIPFIRQNWQREWSMTPEDRLPREILEGAETIGIRTLGVPEEFGGLELDPKTEVQTFALISRGDRARRFRACRQAGAELEGLGAAAQSRAAPSAGEMVQAAARRPAIPARPLPDRAARRLRPVAALQRAGSRDADAAR